MRVLNWCESDTSNDFQGAGFVTGIQSYSFVLEEAEKGSRAYYIKANSDGNLVVTLASELPGTQVCFSLHWKTPY